MNCLSYYELSPYDAEDMDIDRLPFKVVQEKLKSPDFVGDLSLLVANPPANYDIDVAVARIEKDLLSKV